MAQQIINVGAAPNDGQGDPIRTAFQKTNSNFTELYARAQTLPPVSLTGQLGDVPGMYAYDSTYFYYCFDTWDGSSIIWAQVTQVGNISTNQIVSGNSNVVVTGAGGTVTVGVGGTNNIAVFTTTGANITGNVAASGYVLGNGSLLTGLPTTYANANVQAYAESGWSGNIVPSANAAYNLGSATNQWKSLYVSNTTIYLGNVPIGIGAGNTLTVNGQAVLSNDSNANITTTGNVAVGAILTDGYFFANGAPFVASSEYGNANVVANLAALASNPISTTGNITANYFIGDGSQLTGINASGNSISNGNSNVAILTADGNVTVTTAGTNTWTFATAGQTIPPALNVARGDNPSGNISGYTLNLGDGSQEAIITTPDGDADGEPNSQRIVINPGKGADTTSGEGGDIYLWAGRGGDQGGTGGDVKIRGGQGGAGNGQGGYIRIEGGDGDNAGGAPGFIEITGGSGGVGQNGGYVRIQGGQGQNYGADANITGGVGQGGPGGPVNIVGGVSGLGLADYGNVNITSGASTWTFDNTGTLNLPGGTGTVESSANNISIYSDADQLNGMLMYDTGAEIYALQDFAIFTDNANASHIWRFYANGNMTAPGAINVGDMSIGTVPGDITANANTGIILNVSGPDGGFVVDYIKEDGNANTSQGELAFSSETGNTTYRISLTDDAGDGFATKIWRFDGTGVLTLPGEGVLRSIGDSVTLQSINVGSGNANSVYLSSSGGLGFFDQEIGTNWLQIFRSGAEPEITIPFGYGNANLYINNSSSGNVLTWTFGADGTFTAPGNISAVDNITGLISITTPVPLANLVAVAGGRAFVTDANLVAAGNFGANISGGGSNTVPVWSDGTNWYIG